MPQIPTVPDQKVAATKPRPLLVPPEEQFWKRYSPHNEFPLSNATSIALHVIGIGLILLIAYIIDLNRDKKPESDVAVMDPVAMAGPDDGQGDKKGGGGGGGKDGGRPDLPRENVDGNDNKKDNTEPTGGSDRTVLADPPDAPPVEVAKDGAEAPPLTSVQKNLTDIGKRAQETLRQATAGKNKGRPGKDGGRGGDKDTGRNGRRDKGVGREPPGEVARKRAQRQLRWRLIFNRNSDGPDYREKLRAMGAILVVAEFKPGPNGRPMVDVHGRAMLQYRLVIRDIRSDSRPRPENVSKIHRIFWIDDRPESVRALAEALGLRRPPPLFACFFSEKIELELRRLEKEKYPGGEDHIFETHFHVDLAEGSPGYQLVCDEVVLKR